MLIGGIIMACSINKELALILAFVIPILAVLIGLLLKPRFPRFGAMQKKLDNLNSGIQENITNVRVIKSFVRQDFETEKFENANSDLMNTTMRALKIVITTMPIMMLAMNITTLLVVWFGGNFVVGGSMGVGDLTAFYNIYYANSYVTYECFMHFLTAFACACVIDKNYGSA